MTSRLILLGNEAIAFGLVESACTMATSYPGTPASEVLSTLVKLKKKDDLKLHLEWSINEKVAFETALANSYSGRRSAVIMKQVGLNVAADPFMSSAYTGVRGGFVVIVADDPGPHSSQTEQDSRFFAMMAKVPVLDPSSPAEAREFVHLAFALSERYEIPVILRPTTRVCHARQDLDLRPPIDRSQFPLFEKDPGRWAATPKFRLQLHRQLNEKIEKISRDSDVLPRMVNLDLLSGLSVSDPRGNSQRGCAHSPFGNDSDGDRFEKCCIAASGVALANVQEILTDLQLFDRVALYQIPMPYPLSPSFRNDLAARFERVLILEETQPVIELQLRDRRNVIGRTTGMVPSAGELLPEGVEDVVRTFLRLPEANRPAPSHTPGRRPTLCAGCGHRAAFFAIRKAFPKGIYPGDIGCYTLGLNLGAVDTVLCMGASISQAAGFYHAYSAGRAEFPAIVATIGDSTFFHAGIPPLINAVVQGARFVLVILDNRTTAMTGHQQTPAAGLTLDGQTVPGASIAEIVRACGVRYIEECDPYRIPELIDHLKLAGEHARAEDGGVAVIVARRPCLMDRTQMESWTPRIVRVTEKCKGCHFCIKQFECPALKPGGEKEPIQIDEALCSGCGVCVHVCPHGALDCEVSR